MIKIERNLRKRNKLGVSLKTEYIQKRKKNIQIRRFKTLNAREIIHNVLYDQLSTKTFNEAEAYQWSKEIADIIKYKMRGNKICQIFIFS